jgi:hypothetical protein
VSTFIVATVNIDAMLTLTELRRRQRDRAAAA